MYSCKAIYSIALIFCGSKFSRIAVLKEFVENISRMRVAHARGSAGGSNFYFMNNSKFAKFAKLKTHKI